MLTTSTPMQFTAHVAWVFVATRWAYNIWLFFH
jgi:hypothetical protein